MIVYRKPIQSIIRLYQVDVKSLNRIMTLIAVTFKIVSMNQSFGFRLIHILKLFIRYFVGLLIE